MTKGRDLSSSEEWQNFKMHHDRLELPTGQLVTAQQVLVGIALLEIQSPIDGKTKAQILKFARCISKLKSNF